MKRNHERDFDSRADRERPSWAVGFCLALLLVMGIGPHAVLADSAMHVPAPGAEATAERHACMRCHGMATMGYRDPETGDVISLALDLSALSHSVHGELACSHCHEQGYLGYPHQSEHPARELSCVQCHEDHPENTDRIDFSTVDEEFQASVHARSDDPEAVGFSCHSCHNPHEFSASLLGREVADIVRYDNQLCLDCHDELRDPLSLSHSWLPNRDRHWESVRCLDCHTPLNDNGRPVSHEILSAENSNVNCVNCHSQGQGLLRRLYQYRSREDIEDRGFFAKAVYNDAYVVGMSRNPLIDWVGLLLIVLTLLVLGAHGYGRYRAYQALRAQQVGEQQAEAATEGDKQ